LVPHHHPLLTCGTQSGAGKAGGKGKAGKGGKGAAGKRAPMSRSQRAGLQVSRAHPPIRHSSGRVCVLWGRGGARGGTGAGAGAAAPLGGCGAAVEPMPRALGAPSTLLHPLIVMWWWCVWP
jgi:hypothetical protein